jgi:hypothetical protein
MAIRFVVAIAIIVPLMALTGFNNEWYVTFGIAFLGFGAGHLVEHLVKRRSSTDDEAAF